MEKARNEAKEEKQRLKNGYEAQLSERNSLISNMKSEVGTYKSTIERLNGLLVDMTRQRNEKMEEFRKLYQLVVDQNVEIADFENDINTLMEDLQERDERITRYESSYCGIIELSFKITRKRIRNVGTRIGSMFRRTKSLVIKGKEDDLSICQGEEELPA